MKIWAIVPDKWQKLIEEAMEIEGWEKPAQYLRELIKKDLVEKGLLGVSREDQKPAEQLCL